MRHASKLQLAHLLLLACIALSFDALAYSTGVAGRTGKPGSDPASCGECHGPATPGLAAFSASDTPSPLSVSAGLSSMGWAQTQWTFTTAPPPAASLSATHVGDTSVDLAWSGGAPAYRLVYKSGSSPPSQWLDGTAVELGAVTSTTVVGLSPGATYSFTLFSRLPDGQLAFSSSGPTITLTTSRPSVPRSLLVHGATGVDIGPCFSACKTITYAMSQAEEGLGDTIQVAPGTYSPASGEVFPIAFKGGTKLVATGSPGDTVIQGLGDPVRAGLFTSTGSAVASRIEGFRFRSGSNWLSGCSGGGGALSISGSSAPFTIARNVFEHNETRGYSADATPGCPGRGGAIAVFSSTAHVLNNVFVLNRVLGGHGGSTIAFPSAPDPTGGQALGGAIYFDGSGSIANNTFYRNAAIGGNGGDRIAGTADGGSARGGAIEVADGSAPGIVNNIFVANGTISGEGSVVPVPSAAGALRAMTAAPLANNLFHENTVNLVASTGDTKGTAFVEGDPAFLLAPTNLSIRPGSVAAGAGTTQLAPAVDHTGIARPSPPAIGAFEPALPYARMVNIATRGLVLTGDSVLIGGFIIEGSASKTVLVRARGPSLEQFGVPGTLYNPQLTLYSGQSAIAFNDDWVNSSSAPQIQASGFAPENSREPAILATLAPGGYTAIVRGAGNSSGVGIVEVFEVDDVSSLVNISTRGAVQTGDNVLIGGFIVEGNTPQTVLVRARGPSLAHFGVPGTLQDPQLRLHSGQVVIANNDNWVDSPDAAAIQATSLAPEQSNESAILMTLQPGGYTAVVTGVGNTTGVAIVEVFKVN